MLYDISGTVVQMLPCCPNVTLLLKCYLVVQMLQTYRQKDRHTDLLFSYIDDISGTVVQMLPCCPNVTLLVKC